MRRVWLHTVSFALLTALANFASGLMADDWTHFHGSDVRGVATDEKLPDMESDKSIAWRLPLASRNVGSPAVFDGKVYLLDSASDGSSMVVICADLKSGMVRWEKSFPHSSHHLHSRNTYASSTPAVDDQRVVVCWSEPEHTIMKCLDHSGGELWTRDFGTWQSQHGFGTSPRIVGDKIFLFNSQQGEQLKPGQEPGKSRMLAVDAATGNTIWETPLTTKRSCYGVPAIFGDQLIGANTGDGLFGLSMKTGERLWNLPVFEMRCCSSPIVVGDLAIGSSGSGGGGNHLVAVRIPKTPGEKPEQVYRIDSGSPYVPTSVVWNDLLFMIDDKGIASCVNVETGKAHWKKRLGGNHGASPILVGDKLLLISLDGKATVVRGSTEFEKLAEVDLGGPVGATPAIADGHLLIRVGSELVCWK